MEQTSERFLATYLPAHDLREAYRELQQWAERGEVGLLVALFAELEQRGPASEQLSWVPQALADRIERCLALTPGIAQATATLALAVTPRRATARPLRTERQRQAQLAALLAAAQSPLVLHQLFEVHAAAPSEILAVLLHELVVRGHDAAPVPVLRRWAGLLAEQGHPLAWLPLRLAPVEHGFLYVLPRYRYEGASTSPPSLRQGHAQHDTGQIPSVTLRDVTRPEEAERMVSAVAGWCDESNGTVEARIVAIDPPLPQEAVGPGLLSQLGLECLTGADPTSVRLYHVGATDVARQLFAAVVVGGAYSSGRGGAYGRLAAWRSLGALAGLADDATFAECVAGVEVCMWWAFAAPGPWFANIAWDIGLVALRPGGATLAVLAATDTD